MTMPELLERIDVWFGRLLNTNIGSFLLKSHPLATFLLIFSSLAAIITSELVLLQSDQNLLKLCQYLRDNFEWANNNTLLDAIEIFLPSFNLELLISAVILMLILIFMTIRLSRIQASSNPQPLLTAFVMRNEDNLSEYGVNKFRYTSSFISFAHRVEFRDLVAFAKNTTEQFIWWTLIAEAGSGKSRLALEVSLELKKHGWNAGFYSIDRSFNFVEWNAVRNTFIVFDYAGKDIDKVKSILQDIQLSAQNPVAKRKKVRVLLLERSLETPNQWYKEKILGGSGNAIIDSIYSVKPLLLSELDEWGIIQIMGSFLDVDSYNHDKLLADFKSVDDKKRPLFAAMFAHYLAQMGTQIKKPPTREEILEEFLRRSKNNYWQGINANYLTFCALVTMIGKIDKSFDFSELNSDYFPHEPVVVGEFKKILTNYDETAYLAIEPDLIGEFFILELLNVDDDNFLILEGGKRDKMKRLTETINQSWRLSINSTASFLSRVSQDFLYHKTSYQLFSFMPVNREADYQYSIVCSGLIAKYSGTKWVKNAEKIFETLQNISLAHPSDKEITIEYAKGCANLIMIYGKVKRINEAETLFDVLQKTLAEYENEPKIANIKAKGYTGLIFAHIKNKQLDKAERLFEKLQSFSASHIGNKEVALECARGCAYVMGIYGAQSKGGFVNKYLNLLETKYATYINDEEIVVGYCMLYCELIDIYVRDKEFKKAKEAFENIERLYALHNGNEEIILQYITGYGEVLFIYITQAKTEKIEIEKSKELFKTIKYISNPYIESNEDMALYCVTAYEFYACTCLEVVEEKLLYDLDEAFEISKYIAERYPENERIALRYAAVLSYTLKSSKRAEEVFKELTNILTSHPSKGIIEKYIFGCGLIIARYIVNNKIVEAVETFDALEVIVRLQQNDNEIDVAFAKACIIIGKQYCDYKDITGARHMLSILQDLSVCHQNNEEIILLEKDLSNRIEQFQATMGALI